ncbi:hypothetical protein AXG93_1603s1090 [Marchantia polymorpha subsp. ruderalis]|uniref:Uncharacterized protein n=1 Tax=Marchantia polymorpha subsp. ruderalis TaxID=1480154 RepID=A0A176VUW1_MARPO|nr:hypothetical protein AXG93_1603s1090 [Marchantia polymorpha subsp. ruderalis]
MTQALLEEDERIRVVARSTTIPDASEEITIAVAGTLTRTLRATANWEFLKNSDEERMNREKKTRQAAKKDLTERIRKKLAIIMAKKQRAELVLEKVKKRLRPAGPPADSELITEEEMHIYKAQERSGPAAESGERAEETKAEVADVECERKQDIRKLAEELGQGTVV